MLGVSKDRIERAARIYSSNQDASQALGITMRSFGRLCRKYGVETPYVRKCRLIRKTKNAAVDHLRSVGKTCAHYEKAQALLVKANAQREAAKVSPE